MLAKLKRHCTTPNTHTYVQHCLDLVYHKRKRWHEVGRGCEENLEKTEGKMEGKYISFIV